MWATLTLPRTIAFHTWHDLTRASRRALVVRAPGAKAMLAISARPAWSGSRQACGEEQRVFDARPPRRPGDLLPLDVLAAQGRTSLRECGGWAARLFAFAATIFKLAATIFKLDGPCRHLMDPASI